MSEAKFQQAKIAKKQAELNLEHTTIRSPITGTVIARHANIGQVNAPSLFLLAKDLSHVVVEASVNEADIGDIHTGQQASFTVDSCRDLRFPGKVTLIRNDAAMVASVVTYTVLVEAENRDGKLRPGMTAKLQFEVAHAADVVMVPDQALHWRPTWEQITPSARSKFVQPAARKPKPSDTDDDEPDADEPPIDVHDPTVWVRGKTVWSVRFRSSWAYPTA